MVLCFQRSWPALRQDELRTEFMNGVGRDTLLAVVANRGDVQAGQHVGDRTPAS